MQSEKSGGFHVTRTLLGSMLTTAGDSTEIGTINNRKKHGKNYIFCWLRES